MELTGFLRLPKKQRIQIVRELSEEYHDIKERLKSFRKGHFTIGIAEKNKRLLHLMKTLDSQKIKHACSRLDHTLIVKYKHGEVFLKANKASVTMRKVGFSYRNTLIGVYKGDVKASVEQILRDIQAMEVVES